MRVQHQVVSKRGASGEPICGNDQNQQELCRESQWEPIQPLAPRGAQSQ